MARGARRLFLSSPAMPTLTIDPAFQAASALQQAGRAGGGCDRSLVLVTFVHGVKAPAAWCRILRFQILSPQKAKRMSLSRPPSATPVTRARSLPLAA